MLKETHPMPNMATRITTCMLIAIAVLTCTLGLTAKQALASDTFGMDGAYIYKVDDDGEAKITEVDEKKVSGKVVIPAKLGGAPVTEIGSYAFSYCDKMTSVIMPSTVKEIEGSAFSGCTGLKSITFSSKLEEIDNWAFNNCTSLERAVIPSKVKEIDEGAFESCESLTAVYLPTSLKSVGSNAFKSTKLKDIYYAGSKGKWSKVMLGAKNDVMSKATVHYDVKYDASNPDNPSLDGSKPETIKKLTRENNGFTIKWRTAKDAAGYQVRFSLSSKMKSPMIMQVKGQAKSSLKVRGLQDKKTFHVQVRSYKKAAGKTVYSAWSEIKSVKTK